jgi:putative transposase
MFSFLNNTYFFTSTINSWQNLLLKDERKQIILDSLKYLVEKNRISLHAFVIMPNHIHLVLTLGEEETKEILQRDFLRFTSQQIIKKMIANKEELELLKYRSTQKDRIYHIWERRPMWIHVQNTKILEQKINYVHHNPLQEKWKLCDAPEDYYWSSAAFYFLEQKIFGFIYDFRE